MTTGDGEGPSAGPVMPASSDDGAVAAAALCSDSDDLLTTRRGGLPLQPVGATNGHVVADAPTDALEEQAFSGVEMATAGDGASPLAEAPEPAFLVEPIDAAPTEPDSPAVALAFAEPEGPPPAAGAETNGETSVGERAPAAPDAAPMEGAEGTWAAELASSNGVAVHAAATAEFPAVDESASVDVPVAPALTTSAVATDAINDIEIPLPLAAPEAPLAAADSAVTELPLAEQSTELVDAPAMEPGDALTTPFAAEPVVLADPDSPGEPPMEPPAPPLAAAPPPPPAAPPPEEGEEEGATMTIIEHLEELRHRITISAISIVVGAVAGWFITPHVVQYLENAFKKLGGQFLSLTILGPFGLELKLSFLIGLIIASPVVLFQVWGFIAPGLTRREKRYALPFSLIGSGLFAAGAVTGILIVPLAIQFLTHFFAVLDLEQLLDIDKYIMFIALIAVIFGITFELPIFMVGFSLLGVVTSRYFIQKFRIAIFIIFGVSMVITPGADLISPLVLGGFLTVLYWFGVLLIRIIGR